MDPLLITLFMLACVAVALGLVIGIVEYTFSRERKRTKNQTETPDQNLGSIKTKGPYRESSVTMQQLIQEKEELLEEKQELEKKKAELEKELKTLAKLKADDLHKVFKKTLSSSSDTSFFLDFEEEMDEINKQRQWHEDQKAELRRRASLLNSPPWNYTTVTKTTSYKIGERPKVKPKK